jgi:hypothetical protein
MGIVQAARSGCTWNGRLRKGSQDLEGPCAKSLQAYVESASSTQRSSSRTAPHAARKGFLARGAALSAGVSDEEAGAREKSSPLRSCDSCLRVVVGMSVALW